MIDYLMKADTEQDLLADPIIGAYAPDGEWRQDVTFFTTVRPVASDALLPYAYRIIATVDGSPELENHPACVLAVNWGVSPPAVVVSKLPGGTTFKDYVVSPMPLGRDFAALQAE